MKPVYKIIRPETIRDKAKAVELYKALTEIRHATARLVNVHLKTKASSGERNIDIVQTCKAQYLKALGRTDYKIVIERHEKRTTQVFHSTARAGDYADMRDALRSIRDDVQTFRRRNRDFSLDGVHGETGYWFFRQQRDAFSDKRPSDGEKYIGIELECLVPHEAESQIKIQLMPFRKFLSIAGDGSIDCSEENSDVRGDGGEDEYYTGKEYRILAKESVLSEVVKGVTAVLVGAGAIVNRSCGLHVHFDMRDTSEDERNTIYGRLYHALPLLKKIIPKSRRDNEYCQINIENSPTYSGSRYKAINATAYRKHRTFEVRLFNGTLDAVKILNWTALLLAIMRGANVLRCPQTFKTAAKAWGISPEVLAWCEAREARFAPRPQFLHSGTVIDGNEGRDDSANPSPAFAGLNHETVENLTGGI